MLSRSVIKLTRLNFAPSFVRSEFPFPYMEYPFFLDSSTYDYQDFFGLHEQLTEDENALRIQTHEYCQKKLLPRVIKAYRDECKAF